MEKIGEQIKHLFKEGERYERRLNNHSGRLDIVEQEIVAMKKDTSQLQDAIKDLKKAIDSLNEVIASLKQKPLEKYEKIAMMIISAIIGYLVSKLF